jgi:hypothetical protein
MTYSSWSWHMRELVYLHHIHLRRRTHPFLSTQVEPSLMLITRGRIRASHKRSVSDRTLISMLIAPDLVIASQGYKLSAASQKHGGQQELFTFMQDSVNKGKREFV